MGFFSSLTGWDKSMAALNAVMGSYVMENSVHSTKVMITDEIARIISSAQYGKLSKESILSGLNQESRVIQMNFVALACDNLHIEPPFKNSYWERLKNPYTASSQVNEASIEGAIKAFRTEGNAGITWPGTSASFDFLSLYSLDGESKHTNNQGALNTTKMKIAGLAASAVDFVIGDAGLKMLINGSLVLNDKLKPSFRSGIPIKREGILAVVPLKDLKEIEFFQLMSDAGMSDISLFEPFIDQLVLAALREFEKQNDLFANLPSA